MANKSIVRFMRNRADYLARLGMYSKAEEFNAIADRLESNGGNV